jgi:hypothetical protein
MFIIDVPKEFQPNYVSNYPSYSSGKNIEEICYDLIKEKNEPSQSDYCYLPVFWTSFYIMRNYAASIEDLYQWLETLDKTKKYFTVNQYDSGVYVKNLNLNLTVFSAGGGGANINNDSIVKNFNYFGSPRQYFCGKKGDYDIPLMCLPILNADVDVPRDIFCAFMGRFDTHFCRMEMYNTLKDASQFVFLEPSTDINNYKNILSRSVFTLAPRGYGYTSFRLFEAILCGSIPIYIWEGELILPFQDKIRWEDFSIIINIADINNLKIILDNCDVNKLQTNLKRVQYCFNYEFIINYILEKMK